MPGDRGSPGAGLWGAGLEPPNIVVNINNASQSAQPVDPSGFPAPRQSIPVIQARKPWHCACPCSCCCPCCTGCCCCCLCSILAVILVLIGMVAVVFWQVFHPKIPTYNTENIVFHYNVSGTTGTSANSTSGPASYILNAQTKYRVVAKNPNTKIGIYYYPIKVDVEILGLAIGEETIPGFYQDVNTTTFIDGDMKSGSVNLDASTQTALSDAQSSGDLQLNLNVNLKVSAKILTWKTPAIKVGVGCKIVVDPRITTGSQITSVNCKFKLRL